MFTGLIHVCTLVIFSRSLASNSQEPTQCVIFKTLTMLS